MYSCPLGESVTAVGAVRFAVFAVAVVPTQPVWPVPATVWIRPDRPIARTRLLPVSATYKVAVFWS
jgi:hypothetical protein